MLTVSRHETHEEMSAAAADRLAKLIREKPNANVLPATGNTPTLCYRKLAEMGIDTARLRVFQLDAYLGIGANDPRSLYAWLKRDFLDPLNIDFDNVVRLPGDSSDPEAACRAYTEAVAKAGGIDICILGLGRNGHLGFNEPPSNPTSKTRVVELTEASLNSNRAYFDREVPTRALTAGMDIILAARHILLLVAGHHKADIFSKMLHGPITPSVPASYLRETYGVTVFADRAAMPTYP